MDNQAQDGPESMPAVIMNWRPISTAPRHTEVLIYSPEISRHIIGKFTCLESLMTENERHQMNSEYGPFPKEHWREEDWFAADGSRISEDGVVTHWMPLPEPPTEGET